MIQNKAKKGTVELNKILWVLNNFILTLTWVSYFSYGPNEYINLNTVIIGTVLSLEISFFLWMEKKRRDPFVIILCFQMVFYYVFRVLTLTIYPFSVSFERFPFSATNLNYAILFIIVANLAIFLGLYVNEVKIPDFFSDTRIRPRKPFLVLLVLMFVYFMVFSASIGPLAILIGLINSLFINILIVILMLAIYIILFYKKLSLKYKIFIAGGLLFYIAFSTLSGSRSAVISISYLFLFSLLSIFTIVRVKRTYLVVAAISVPVLIVFFTVATFLRPRLENKGSVGGETIQVLKDFDFGEALSADKEIILAPIFDRIAFLDFAAEVISNEDKYHQVFTFEYYLKSIVDNVLTPGFDVFDTPKTSISLTFIYNNYGEPKKSKVADAYQSDEFTLFGEFYVMFGKWFSIIPIFFTAFLFKRLYVKISDKNRFLFYVKRSFVLYIYFTLLNSFGLDWLLFDVIGMLFTYYIFKNFFKFQDLSLGQPKKLNAVNDR